MNDNRIASFDIAKTIALFGVLLGHTLFLGVPQSIVDFFYSFDMPLFFIVSGYFCKRESLSRSFVFKNARGLLIPYIFTSIVIIICMTCRAFFVSDDPAKTAIGWTVAALYGSGDYLPGMPTGVIAIGAIWYLLALFRVSCYWLPQMKASIPSLSFSLSLWWGSQRQIRFGCRYPYSLPYVRRYLYS